MALVMIHHSIFITGATGYLGRALIPALLGRGHTVRALARPASVQRIPPGAQVIAGDALDPESFAHAVAPADTLVHLVGTPHPGPGRNPAFRAVDLHSVDAALAAAATAGVRHFVYVSVAQPAPVMWHYIAVRQVAESRIRASGLAASILRPWYVIGPGHRWPGIMIPFYALGERIPATRDAALRLGFVSLAQMVRALVAAVEQEPGDVRVVEVPAIRATAEHDSEPLRIK
jgi:uncharacterized protein YbjT (DUF2867 family)